MSSLTRPPLAMIDGGQQTGNVQATGTGVEVISEDGVATELAATYDNNTGQLSISVPGYSVITVSGFATISDLGSGTAGSDGAQGRPGVDGTVGSDGAQGEEGCVGPRGSIGPTGPRGQMGREGEQGPEGPTGGTGATGADGIVLTFIQEEDPGPVGAGALWIKPQYD